MIDNIETLLQWKATHPNEEINEDESVYIKQLLKRIEKTFPCEWDEALEEVMLQS